LPELPEDIDPSVEQAVTDSDDSASIINTKTADRILCNLISISFSTDTSIIVCGVGSDRFEAT
jgi:hypothetical protein